MAAIATGYLLSFTFAIVPVLAGAGILIYGTLRTVRPALYVLSFAASAAAVIPINVLGLPLMAGVTLNFWDQLVLLAILLPWGLRKLLANERISVPGKGIPFLLVLMLAWATVAFAYGLARGNSFHPAVVMYRPYVYAVAIYLVVADEIMTAEQLRTMVWAWLLGAALVGPLALLLKVAFGDTSLLWPDLWDNAPSQLAYATRLIYVAGRSSAFGLIVLMALWLRRQASAGMAIVLAAGMGVSVVLSLTRAHYAGLVVGLAVMLVLSGQLKVSRWLTISVGIAAGIATLSLLISSVPGIRLEGGLWAVLPQRFLSAFDLQDPNLQKRILESTLAWRDVLTQPVLGFGLGGQRPSAFLSGSYVLTEWNLYYVHNAFITAALQGGIPMMAVSLLFAVALFRTGWQLSRGLQGGYLRALTEGLAAAVVCMVAIGMTGPEFLVGGYSVVVTAPLWAGWLTALQRGFPEPG